MIIPWLEGILKPSKVPFTWIIIICNLLVFCFLYFSYADVRTEYSKMVDDEKVLSIQGKVYAQFILANKKNYTFFMIIMAEKSIKGFEATNDIIGSLSIRDPYFLKNILSFNPVGDDIEINEWEVWLAKVLTLQKDHPNFKWGVNSSNVKFINMISYQFLHGGWTHLIINMLFLLLFGAFVESVAGGIFFVFTYLICGIFAAYFFDIITGLSMAPLIGASGSVNGLVGISIGMLWPKKIKCWYFILPKEKYWGTVGVPAWMFLIYWTIADFTSLLATVPELGGVAYSAHLGGVVLGLLIGFLWQFFSRKKFRSKSTT